MLLIIVVLCAIAVITDFNTRRIPNWLTISAAAVALAHHALAGPWHFAVALATLGAALVVGFLLFSVGWLGAGDVKLIAAITAFFGFPVALGFLLYTVLSGGVLAIITASIQGRVRDLIQKTILTAQGIIAGEPRLAPLSVERSKTMPYAAAIAAGLIAAVLSNIGTPAWSIGL